MCTVTYLPLKQGFIITQNRDEHVLRALATPPQAYFLEGETFIYPIDTTANGTWIFCKENGVVRCLLNGAFRNHVSKPPYRKSRGLILKETMPFDLIEEYFIAQNIDLEGIEPFTMLNFTGTKVEELRWDGLEKYYSQKNPQEIHLWCSATLFDENTLQNRTKNLFQFIDNQKNINKENIIDFHLSNLPFDPLLVADESRGYKVATVSVTQFEVLAQQIAVKYLDLRQQKQTSFIYSPYENLASK